jgi:hypothetical protein
MLHQHANNKHLIELSNYVRSMGRKCYIEGSKLAVEIEYQRPTGSFYTLTHHITTRSEAERLIQDE